MTCHYSNVTDISQQHKGLAGIAIRCINLYGFQFYYASIYDVTSNKSLGDDDHYARSNTLRNMKINFGDFKSYIKIYVSVS